jgi:hypothetical protein
LQPEAATASVISAKGTKDRGKIIDVPPETAALAAALTARIMPKPRALARDEGARDRR